MAAFMEFLDTSIANVALPYMAGNLGATNDESTWILTSFLASNAIVLPLSGWLAGFLGRKRFFMTCLALFTLSSLLCGLAPNLGSIILFRTVFCVVPHGDNPGTGAGWRYIPADGFSDVLISEDEIFTWYHLTKDGFGAGAKRSMKRKVLPWSCRRNPIGIAGGYVWRRSYRHRADTEW